MQTVQPSEPVLAISSTEHMIKDPQTRLDIIKVMYNSTTKGTIHLGDIGEMVFALLLLFSYDKPIWHRCKQSVGSRIRES